MAFDNEKDTTSFAGYTLKRSVKGTKGRIVVFDLDLRNGKSIKIHCNNFTGIVFVNVEGYLILCTLFADS